MWASVLVVRRIDSLLPLGSMRPGYGGRGPRLLHLPPSDSYRRTPVSQLWKTVPSVPSVPAYFRKASQTASALRRTAIPYTHLALPDALMGAIKIFSIPPGSLPAAQAP
jgi:hypothetical protein